MDIRTAEATARNTPVSCAVLACLLLAAVTLGASASPGPGSESSGALSLKRHYFVLNGLRRVAGQWGELAVPENRRNARSRQIQVTFGRLQSARNSTGVPIFFIAGGPGASGIGSFAGNAGWLLPLRSFGDIVLVEQRGTGHSRPRLDCAERWDFSITAPLAREQLIDSARQRFAALFAKSAA